MSIAKSICEEFCETVIIDKVVQQNFRETIGEKGQVVEELKCRLEVKYFTPLVERMVGAGYCCTQVQKDLKTDLCTAWFEPQSLDF